MIEQSDSGNETSDCPSPVFDPKGGYGAAQPNEDDESITKFIQMEHPATFFMLNSILPINAPEGAPPNIRFVESYDDPVVSDDASIFES